MTDFGKFYQHESIFRTCQICIDKEPFTSRQALVDHYTTKHDHSELHKCEMCNPENFLTDRTAICHLRVHFSTREYTCIVCDFTTNYLVNMKSHIKTIHASVFAEEDLKKELLSYIPQPTIIDYKKFYFINYCMRCESSGSSLAAHIKSKHDGIYQCHVCDKRFSSPKTFRLHLEEHNSLAEYQCKICKIRIKTLHNIKIHLHDQHYSQLHVAGYDITLS